MASFRTMEDNARFRLAEDQSGAGRDCETGSQKLLSSQTRTQSEVRHAAVKLVLSRRHGPETARAVPGRGTARNTRKPLVDALSAVKTARGAARISMVFEAKDENSRSRFSAVMFG